jgi:hypothetical protein
MRLAFDPDQSYTERNPITQREIPYIRLRVENERGKKAAERVQVLAISAERVALENDDVIGFASAPLAWTHGGELGDPSRLTIAPGIARFVDLGCAIPPGASPGLPRSSPWAGAHFALSLGGGRERRIPLSDAVSGAL